MRLLCPVLAATVVLACVAPPGVFRVRRQSVEVDPEPTRRRQFGALTLLAAFQLDSSHPRFGGLSSLALGPEGDRLTILSDRGVWLRARLNLDVRGVLKALDEWRIEPIRDPLGEPVAAPRHDAESLVYHPQEGAWLVGFERDHRVWRYRSDLASSRPVRLALPRALRDAPGNGSLEAMTVLADGRVLVLCEKYRHPDGTLRGWVGGEGDWSPIAYVASEAFAPTDLTTLPGSGDVLVLERAFSLLRGTRARVRRLAASSIQPHARLQPGEIGRLTPPIEVDNFEGLAAQRHRGTGSMLLYMISDDNFSPLQRTLLYQFRLTES